VIATVPIVVDGAPVRVEEGITLAAALMNAGIARFRASVDGEARGPLCAMGICHECRVTVDGVRHRRSCLVLVVPGMEVETGG